jgi:hypothetical protein
MTSARSDFPKPNVDRRSDNHATKVVDCNDFAAFCRPHDDDLAMVDSLDAVPSLIGDASTRPYPSELLAQTMMEDEPKSPAISPPPNAPPMVSSFTLRKIPHSRRNLLELILLATAAIVLPVLTMLLLRSIL